VDKKVNLDELFELGLRPQYPLLPGPAKVGLDVPPDIVEENVPIIRPPILGSWLRPAEAFKPQPPKPGVIGSKYGDKPIVIDGNVAPPPVPPANPAIPAIP
jgi:hypothetical protein